MRSFLERFAIFSREQQQVQTDAHGTDLLSYVQLQRNLRWDAGGEGGDWGPCEARLSVVQADSFAARSRRCKQSSSRS